ncbi:MAG: fused MFS/spermidine synthase [bacterium]
MSHKQIIENMQKYFLFIFSFFAGFFIMHLEMCGFRVLTTHYGSSIFTTGTYLTLVMIFLSIGYYMGGKLSESYKDVTALLILMLILSFLVYIIHIISFHYLTELLFSLQEKIPYSILFKTILPTAGLTTLLYALPMIILSQVPPYMIKLYCLNEKYEMHTEVGNVSGRFMAFSTMGSVAGALITSYFLIPLLGINNTVLLFIISLLMLLMASLILFDLKIKKLLAPFILILFALIIINTIVPLKIKKSEDRLIYERETSYGNIKVYDIEGKLLYKPNRFFMHSFLYPDNPLKNQFGLSLITPSIAHGARDFLILGAGAGNNIRQLLEIDPSYTITAVEIDPEVIKLSEELFGVVQSDRVKLIAEDARVFLKNNKKKFDSIIIDLFKGDSYPIHCITEEFFALALNNLKPNGMIMVNSNMSDLHLPYNEKITVFRPLWHLYATIYNAGFKSIFLNDIFRLGFIYAYREPISHEKFMNQLYQIYTHNTLNKDVKANVAFTMLRAVEIPSQRHTLRPFTDDWAPEHKICAKSNFHDIALAYREFIEENKLGPLILGKNSAELSFIDLKSLLSIWKRGKFHPTQIEYDHYYSEVAVWAEENEIRLNDLSKFLFADYSFDPHALPFRKSANVRLITDYLKGVLYIMIYEGKEALPYLDRSLKSLWPPAKESMS